MSTVQMLALALLLLLVLCVPAWGYNRAWGYGPAGLVVVLLVVVLVSKLLGVL